MVIAQHYHTGTAGRTFSSETLESTELTEPNGKIQQSQSQAFS
jgi:hypothetical protein